MILNKKWKSTVKSKGLKAVHRRNHSLEDWKFFSIKF